MSTTPQSNTRFFHLEKVFTDPSTFIITVVFSALAYVTANLSTLYVSLEVLPRYIPPFMLGFSIAMVLFAAVQTRNFVPAFFVAVAASLGMTPALSHSNVALAEIYLLALVLTSLILAWAVSRFRLLSTWNKLLFSLFLIFGMWTLQFAYFMRYSDFQQRYWSNNIAPGFGGNGGLIDQDIPLIDLGYFIFFLIIWMVLFFRYRNQLSFSMEKAKQAKIIGVVLIILSQLVTFITLLWTQNLPEETILKITGAKYIQPLEDLFTKTALFPVVLTPMNIVMNALASTALVTIGIMVLNVGKESGTISGTKGGPEMVLLAAPIFTMLFLQMASYPVQNLIYSGGYFVPGELFMVYFTVIWSLVTISQIVAWILLSLVSLIRKDDN